MGAPDQIAGADAAEIDCVIGKAEFQPAVQERIYLVDAAALFFFLDGRDDLARSYLATAKEMGADIREPERVFREGLLRSVAEMKQDPK